jgi:hypothetical protein
MIIWKSKPSEKNYIELSKVILEEADLHRDEFEDDYDLDIEEFEYNLKLEIDIDFDLEFELELLGGEEPFTITTTLNKIVKSLNGVYYEYEDKEYDYQLRDYVSKIFKKPLQYNPITGKTWTGMNTGHFKEADYKNRGDLNKFTTLNPIDHEMISLGLDVIQRGKYSILFLPCSLLSLLVHYNVEQSELWPLFLRRMGFIADGKRKVDLPFETSNYILIKFKTSNCGVTVEQAIAASGCSISKTHISISFEKGKWFRENRSEEITWEMMESFFNGDVLSQSIDCLCVEEHLFGLASIHFDKKKTQLLDFYNGDLSKFDKTESNYFSFSPISKNNSVFVLAVGRIKKNAIVKGEDLLEYCWNIYSMESSKWLFSELLPRGLSAWTKLGGLLIGKDKISIERNIALNQEIANVLNSQEIAFKLVTNLDLEISLLSNWVIDFYYKKRKIQAIEDWSYRYGFVNGPYIINNNLQPPAHALLKFLIEYNDDHNEYQDYLMEEVRDAKSLDALNRQGLDEIRDDNPDFFLD